MADTKRNALAKLAVRLGTDVLSLGRDKYPEIEKASRIVAELAKVRWWRSPSRWMPRGNDVSDILIKCLAIAEEGEKMTRGNEDRKLSMCDVCIHNGAKSCKGLAKCNFMRMTDDAQSEEAK